MLYNYFIQFGPFFSWVGLFCGLFFFIYSVRYYVVSILVLMKDQKALQEHVAAESKRTHLGFVITRVEMKKHLIAKMRRLTRRAKDMQFKVTRVKTELLINEIKPSEAGYVTKKISLGGNVRYQRLLAKLRRIYWEIKVEKNKIIVHPARLGIRKRLHALLILIMKKASYEEVRNVLQAGLSLLQSYLTGQKSLTVSHRQITPKTSQLAQCNFSAQYLGFRQSLVGSTSLLKKMAIKHKRLINKDSIDIVDDPAFQPFISLHLAFYNEENVAERCIEACLAQDYEQYEIVIADDSNDRTPEIIAKYANHPKIKIVRRDNRVGYKGGALKAAIAATDPRAVFITVYDADFVPPPNTLKMFMREFYHQNGNTLKLNDSNRNLAAIQGYQWHVLNKDENFVTAGIRFGFAGGYMVERVAQQFFGAMKMIAGSVFVIRRDVMEKFTWQMPDGYTSIVEDWNLTIRMYLEGWKIGYTPDIKVPAECVNSLQRLSKQQIRWAEGHTWNVKTYFWRVMTTAKMTLMEKLEFLYYGPFYLQSSFFIIGTIGWIVGELIFHAKVPGWTATLGWSLVFTNLMALPVMCVSGIVLERGENRDYNILPFLTFVYYIIPSLAYASIRGLFEKHESGWVRTKKTGSITDGVIEGKMAGSKEELVEKNVEIFKEGLEKAAKQYNAAHPLYNVSPTLTEELQKKGRLWIELKRVPRLGFIIILIMAIALGSLGYLASTQVTMASADVLYLNSPAYLSANYANSPTNVAIGPNNTSYSWYSDVCPSGDDAGGVAAGNYSAYLVLNQKPTVDKVYALSVGHVDVNGGDYQAITSTTLTINQSTPNTLSINLGNGPSVVCTKENKRKLIFTIQYLYATSQCDQGCNELAFNNDEVGLTKTNLSSRIENNNSSSMISTIANMLPKAKAVVMPCNQEMCYYIDDITYFATYSLSKSGTFPQYGSTADQVTVTKYSPRSTGYIDIPLSFEYVPDELSDPNISIDFDDLDLQGDTIYSGSNTATLFETFGLYDVNGNQIAYLDSSYGQDDNFSWSTSIDKNLITNNTLTLRARVTSTVTLTKGTSMTIGNSSEELRNISLCGTYICPIPQTIELTAAKNCNSINLSWSKYTDQTITGYKIFRSTSDNELTYPEDAVYQTVSGQSTVSYSDTNVTNGQGYYYRVLAYYGSDNISYSDTEYIVADTSYNCPSNQTVTPTLKCIDDNGNGTYLAHFGYNNPNSSTINIAVGNKNKFSPNPKDRGQTTSFLAGNYEDAFQVNFNGSTLSWYLKSPNGQSATVVVSKYSTKCTTACCDDDLVIGYNNGTSSLSTPSIIVPEYTLLFGVPLVVYYWLKKDRRLVIKKIN